MSNFFEQYGQQQPNNFGLMGQINEFAKTIQGDPKQQVMNLLQSGKMSQAQFDQLSQMAQALQNKR